MNNINKVPNEADAKRCMYLRKLADSGVKLDNDNHSFVVYMMNTYLDWFIGVKLNSEVKVMNEIKSSVIRTLEVKPEMIDAALLYLQTVKKVYDSYKEAAKMAVEKYNVYVDAENKAWEIYRKDK